MSPALTGVRCSIQVVNDNDPERVSDGIPGIAVRAPIPINRKIGVFE